MKNYPVFFIAASLLFTLPVVAAPGSTRAFTYTPNAPEEHEYSGSGQVVMNARTVAIVNPYLLITSMMVTPRTLNPRSVKGGAAQEPDVQIKLYMPPAVHHGPVLLSAFELNGQPVTPALSPSAPGLFTPPNAYTTTADFVHLFFDRDAVLNILGPLAGERTLILQAKIGGENTILASDTITMLAPKIGYDDAVTGYEDVTSWNLPSFHHNERRLL